jgi:hypothetical protein
LAQSAGKSVSLRVRVQLPATEQDTTAERQWRFSGGGTKELEKLSIVAKSRRWDISFMSSFIGEEILAQLHSP